MKAIIRAFVWSRICGAARTAVAGLDGISVSFDNESAGTPRRLYLTMPGGGETFTDLAGGSDEACALDAMRFLGLA
jgi:hypothetical protein